MRKVGTKCLDKVPASEFYKTVMTEKSCSVW